MSIVAVPTPEQEQQRSVVRHRGQLLRDRRRARAQLASASYLSHLKFPPGFGNSRRSAFSLLATSRDRSAAATSSMTDLESLDVKFNKVPLKRPRLTMRHLRERDGGCYSYTERVLKPEECSMEHVIPRSKGGATEWKNVVLADSGSTTFAVTEHWNRPVSL
jgi:hypothetical protein